MNALSNWPRNRLLLALPSRNLKRLMPELEHIRCQREQVLMDADSSLDHVFFPDSGVVSVVAVYADGSIIEMATIGREGCTGVQAVFGAKTSSVRLLVQIPGSAAKMSRAAFTGHGVDAVLPKSHVRLRPGLSGAGHGVGSVQRCAQPQERLARWLLMMRDRSDDDALQITQDLLAEMLGVQRPTITNAARELERAGLIERGRQQVTILDRQGLIARHLVNVISWSGARRFSPSQNIYVKKSRPDSVMYITDNIPKLAHNQDRREAEMASLAGSYSCCRG